MTENIVGIIAGAILGILVAGMLLASVIAYLEDRNGGDWY
jgi:hypothetical protein